MVELPKTEEELQALIEKKLEEQKEAHKKELQEVAYNTRKAEEAKLEKYKNDMKLSEEERAKKLAEEKEKALNDELSELRSFKKASILKERLTKENLPSYFANDNRLINAEEGELDKTIKVVKGEYEASLPKGNTVSTVVNVATTSPNKDGKDKGLDGFAQVLEEAIKG